MFLRLLLAFLGFALFAAAIVAMLIGRRTKEVDSADAIVIVVVAVAIAILPAWLFARGFVRPFRDMRVGAERMARGDYEQRIHGGVWRESRELASTLNELSERLVDQIDRLDAERQHLRAILGGMSEGVVGVGPGQRVIFANDAAGRMLDFDPTATIGRPFYEVTRQPAVQAILENAMRSAQAQRDDMELKKPVSRFLSVHVAPLDEAGAPGAVMVLNDTSELRRLERLRHEFVANVSHELKTPLAVMKACVETLQDGAVEDPETRVSFLQQIADGADRLHALILDLLSLARIESGDEILDYDNVPVRETVLACLERHRPRAVAKGITLEAVPPSESVSVWVDEEAFGQILDNLVDNAVKYTPAGGIVRVRWSAEGDTANLNVEDNGPGIPERDLTRIFERFYRVDKARARELGGTGLGLSIVKHLTQTMHGTVTASSRLGQGSVFTVRLPVGMSAAPPGNGEPAA